MLHVLTPDEVRAWKLKIIVNRTRVINDLFHVLLIADRCNTGGPLEIIWEGRHVRDQDLIFCYRLANHPDWDHVTELAELIIHELIFMDEQQRLLFLQGRTAEEIVAAEGKRI